MARRTAISLTQPSQNMQVMVDEITASRYGLASDPFNKTCNCAMWHRQLNACTHGDRMQYKYCCLAGGEWHGCRGFPSCQMLTKRVLFDCRLFTCCNRRRHTRDLWLTLCYAMIYKRMKGACNQHQKRTRSFAIFHVAPERAIRKFRSAYVACRS